MIYNSGAGIFTIIVPNIMFYELPSTGGSGIYWYMISGMLFMAAAVLMTYRYRRKREREVLRN